MTRDILGRLACQIITMLPEDDNAADETLAIVQRLRDCLSEAPKERPRRDDACVLPFDRSRGAETRSMDRE